jgi:hypothetical protein
MALKSRRLLVPLVAAALLVAAGAAAASGGQRRPFVPPGHYTQAALPAAAGLGVRQNGAAEPGRAVDGGGTVWVAANIAQLGVGGDPRSFSPPVNAHAPLPTGADVWRSTDSGRTFQWVADPFATGGDNPGPAGLDTDVAAAPERNATGSFNVYVVSNWLVGAAVAISQDGGQTWTVHPLNNVPVIDRPWINADGPCTFYVSYHTTVPYDTVVSTYDACDAVDGLAPQSTGSALSPVQGTEFTVSSLELQNRHGKPSVDSGSRSPYRHQVYVPMLDCYLPTVQDQIANMRATAEGSLSCSGPSEVVVGVSDDAGATFEDYRVAFVDDGRVPNWAVATAVDAAGTVYVTWSDDHHAYLSRSSDGGHSWSPATLLAAAPGAETFPTPAAGDPGRLAVAWYGTTDRSGDVNDLQAMGDPAKTSSAAWYLFIGESVDGGRTWSRTRVGQPVHYGQLCTLGSSCSGTDGSHTMYENFGAVLSPVTQRPVVAYMDDQPGGTVDGDHVVATAWQPGPPPCRGPRRGC